MEDYDERPIVIDGFSSVQAIRRAQKRTESRHSKKSAEIPDQQTENTHAKKSGVRIDHTVIPQKHEIACYECDYIFMISGRIQDTICPKCHKPLRMTNHVINNECTESVRTIGTIEVKAEGVLNGAEIRARDIILAGNAENGSIRAGRRLELCKGARFNIKKTRMKDLMIRKGGEFVIPSTISCRNLEVEGILKTRIFADGMVTIKRGGILDGELHTPHLVVEDG
ncbi:MAG: polymer-forming cytoskeletal protein, partial [Kiritimatiellae bacterium]|nr:polymer-forming cytoskeletal protein [Kiritimatiellia bacterium]